MADVTRNLSLDSSEPDARLRILMLQTAYVSLCDRRGWKFVEEAQKAAVKHLIAVLQPPLLKSRIEDSLQLEKNSLKNNFFGFCEFLTDEAEVCERFQSLNDFRRTNASGKKKKGVHYNASGSKEISPKSSSSHSGGSSSSRNGKKPSRKLPPCLNAKCNKHHLVKDCDITTDEEKDQLLAKTRAERTKKKDDTSSRVAALIQGGQSHMSTPNCGASTSAVLLAELQGHSFACRLDSGADQLAISDTIVKFLNDKKVFLPTLNDTQRFKSVDGRVVQSQVQVQISPVLNTAAVKCRLRNIRMHIVPDADSAVRPGAECAGEIVLGNPFRLRAGLNVADFLADNLDRLADIDYSYIHRNPSESRIGKLASQLLLPKHTSQRVAAIAYSPHDGNRLCSRISNGDFPLQDGDDVDYKDVDIGEQDEAQLQAAIYSMIRQAERQLPKHYHQRLREIFGQYAEVFRTRLGKDPPVDVPPMKVEFEKEEKPVKVRQRTYSPEQLKIMKKKVNELEELGFIYRNPNSKWSCAPLIVPKDGPEKFRFTSDVRPVNAQTKKNQWPMPHADAMLARPVGAIIFFLLDFIHGYWQFGLHPLSQDCLSFITPFGVYTPTRVPHGAMNSVAYFQSSMESMFNHLELLIWLDDILGYAKTYTELLDKLENTLQVCAKKGLKLHPAKYDLATKEVKFCGRLIDKKGVRFNPRNYEALINMPKPVTIGALMELVHGVKWMRSAIPRFAELVEPLQKLLEQQYILHKTRKKNRVFNRPLSSWGDQEDNTFQCLIQAIATQVKLAIPNPAKRLCVFTDTSSTHWAGVLTQACPSDVFNSTTSPQDWEHEPVAFVSGSFKGSSSRWSTPEQECYAIIASVTRLCHILAACTEFSLLTDHKIILYMLSSSRFDTNVPRHIVHKTQRWALRLAEFSYSVEHIPGESNVWADMLTRWASQDNANYPARKMASLRVPLITEDLPDLPSVVSIAQSHNNEPPQSGFSLSNMSGTEVWVSDAGKLYIPSKDTEMQLRICVAAHCGLGGHRGKTATKSIIQEKVIWPTLDADTDAFCQSCLVCLISATGEKVPRPFRQQDHVERVGELLHFDFLYIGESATGPEYILILKDDFSGYVFLRPCGKADARSTASALVEYFTTFVPVLKWFSDQGPHLCNEVMQLLTTTLGVRHRFSTVYAPWTNGTVEAVCKEVLCVLHAVSTELQVPETEWPTVVPGVQSIINNSPS